jgi:hypothetical protein
LRNLRPCRYRSHRTDVGLRDDVRSCGAAFRSQAENNRQDGPLSTKVLFAVKLSEWPIASQAQSGRLLAFPFFGAKCDPVNGRGWQTVAAALTPQWLPLSKNCLSDVPNFFDRGVDFFDTARGIRTESLRMAPPFGSCSVKAVASPRNQISQFLSFALDEFNFFIPSDSVLQARGQSSCYDPFAAPARSARSA